MKKIVTHDSDFHSDDAFAVATLQIYLDKLGEKYKVIRSRDNDIINSGDYVVDVGSVYDEDIDRYDHHQPEFTEKGYLDIPYSSFGLVWKHFGKELCENNKNVWLKIRNEFVTVIDANDNGIQVAEPKIEGLQPLSTEIFIFSFRPSYNERTDENLYKGFLNAVSFAKNFLNRKIQEEIIIDDLRDDFENAIKSKKNFLQTDSIKALILPKPLPWRNYFNYDSDIDFIIMEREDGKWMATGIPPTRHTMKVKVFKKSWAGLRDEELSEKAGVKDLIFYHKTGYILVGKTKDSIINALNKF